MELISPVKLSAPSFSFSNFANSFSVTGFLAFDLAADGIYIAPAAALHSVDFTLFLLGKLFVRDEFFHDSTSCFVDSIINHRPTLVK